MIFMQEIPFYSENHTKDINIFCGQNAQSLNVKASGAYSY
jgi:hypothetical protein